MSKDTKQDAVKQQPTIAIDIDQAVTILSLLPSCDLKGSAVPAYIKVYDPLFTFLDKNGVVSRD